MKVKCIANRFLDLPKELQEYYGPKPDPINSHSYITVGNEYIVYGIGILKKRQLFLVCEDHYDGKYIVYPNYLYHGFFRIIDPRVSSFWIARDAFDFEDGSRPVVIMGLPDFLKNPEFHSNLTDNISPDVEAFISIKEKMDLEFK